MTNRKDIADLMTQGMSEFIGNNYEKSIQFFSEVISIEPDNRLALISRGSAFLKTGKVTSSIEDFDRVIQQFPEYAKGWHLRGLAREKKGDDIGALSDFDQAIGLDPEYGAAYYSRAGLHNRMGMEGMAANDIQMVTHLTSRNVESYAGENNVWHTQHFRVEEMMESELNR